MRNNSRFESLRGLEMVNVFIDLSDLQTPVLFRNPGDKDEFQRNAIMSVREQLIRTRVNILPDIIGEPAVEEVLKEQNGGLLVSEFASTYRTGQDFTAFFVHTYLLQPVRVERLANPIYAKTWDNTSFGSSPITEVAFNLPNILRDALLQHIRLFNGDYLREQIQVEQAE